MLLADAVWTWEQAAAMGPVAFSREVARGDRGRRGGGNANGDSNGNGNGFGGNGYGSPAGGGAPAAVPVGPGTPAAAARLVRTIPLVSPLRGVELEGSLDVYFGAGPVVRAAATALAGPSSVDTDESPLPAEQMRELLVQQTAATLPVQAAPGQVLHIKLLSEMQDEVLAALSGLRGVIHEHPGDTPVVLHVPSGAGRFQRMELRLRVAYDAELVSTISRRVGERLVELSLGR